MLEFIGAVLGLLGTVGAGVVAYVASVNKRAHEAEMALSKAQLTKMQEDLDVQRRNLEAAWKKLDELRDTAVRRAEWKEYREEVRADMNRLGDRLEDAIKQLRDELRGKGGA